jgi:hypothetical protein
MLTKITLDFRRQRVAIGGIRGMVSPRCGLDGSLPHHISLPSRAGGAGTIPRMPPIATSIAARPPGHSGEGDV